MCNILQDKICSSEKWDDSKIIQDVVSAVTALKCNLKGGRDAPLSLSSTEAVGSTLDRNSSSFAGKVQCQFWPFPIPNRKNIYPQHEQIQYISTFSTFWGKKTRSFSIFTYHNIYIYTYTLLIYCIFIRIWGRTNIPAVSSKLSDKTRASNPPGSVSPWFDSYNLIEIHHFWPKIRLDQIYKSI